MSPIHLFQCLMMNSFNVNILTYCVNELGVWGHLIKWSFELLIISSSRGSNWPWQELGGDPWLLSLKSIPFSSFYSTLFIALDYYNRSSAFRLILLQSLFPMLPGGCFYNSNLTMSLSCLKTLSASGSQGPYWQLLSSHGDTIKDPLVPNFLLHFGYKVEFFLL